MAILALSWRLLMSDLGVAAHRYRVTSVARRAEGTTEVTLAPCRRELQVEPGQFVLTAFGDGPHYRGCGESPPFTVSDLGL